MVLLQSSLPSLHPKGQLRLGVPRTSRIPHWACALLHPPFSGSLGASLTVYVFLQFERVFVINLPERYDKLDAFSLAASVTGFTYDVIEGIKGSTVVNKTLPALEGLPQVTLLLAVLWSSQRLTLDPRKRDRGTISLAVGART